MNLKSIKLSGFKSFADPITIQFPSALTAVVGPNGCGKSNIVDALRWVIGESSAKQLRGEHLSDVIFNGAANRKPMGQASIELLFDNKEARFGGEYAQYNEIAIRREITRDGQSNFYLNGAGCRRRDIRDLFLGTGLGPNSYAIIEQGVISKLVEGKPEEIRTYLEEAAGTSKYRERRRETENRLRHTRENLERLTDIRLEMEKQLEHLKRQANAAEKYKILKQEQRLMRAQLHALQCQSLDQHLAEQERLLSDHTTALEGKIAEHRSIDAAMEQHRVLQTQTNDDFNTVQARYYQVGAEVARQEQQISHIQTQLRQLTDDLTQMESAWQEAEQHLEEDRDQIETLTSAIASLEPQAIQAAQAAEQSAQALQQAEQNLVQSQSQWEQFQAQASVVERQAEVEQTRLHHLSQKIQGIAERLMHIDQQRIKLNAAELPEQITALTEQTSAFKAQLDMLQTVLSTLNQQIQQQQQANREWQAARDQQQQAVHQLLNQKASLEALQQAAMGKHNQNAVKWLASQGWEKRPRLLEGLVVEKGWETAVETVLAPYLEAVCTDNFSDFERVAQDFKEGRLSVFHIDKSTQRASFTSVLSERTPLLVAKLQSSYDLFGLLEGIYTADTIEEALKLLASLQTHESIITREGFWFGPTWLRVSKIQDETSGVLQRKQALQEIESAIETQQQQLQAQAAAYQQGQQSLLQLEQERDGQQQVFRQLSVQCSESQAQLSAQQAHLEQLHRQEKAIAEDAEKLTQQQQAAEAELQTAKLSVESAQAEKEKLAAQKPAIVTARQALEAERQQARHQAQVDKLAVDECQVKLSATQSQLHYLNQNIQRAERQLTQLQERRESIEARESSVQEPLADLQAALQTLLDERVVVERNLTAEKQKLSHFEDQWRQYEKQRVQVEKDTQAVREALEKIRIVQTTAITHRENHLAQISEIGYELAMLLQEMPAEANEAAWQQELERVENRIQRLGAINLAAIEEFQSVSERKTYLDSQDKDLNDALQTLEDAIHKIDRESRARLRETFDKANANFKTLFTRMFEGGNAELEWVGDEVLTAGVVIRAQPAGKRNALLHLLSGGEKALTAIALVFALFQLNPAPFCVLDEVDAPLDDANVGRFCRLVKSMSSSVQFLFISHNKATMEMAQQMIGITMQEPGVSRLVSVDMEQAIAMVEMA
jgi:chromosome segregation protein